MKMRIDTSNSSYHYYNVAEDIVAFTTTRLGGKSLHNYHSFNLSKYTGDEETNVDFNIDQLCKDLDIDRDRLIYSNQVHSDKICTILNPFDKRELNLEGYDAFITNVKDICIGVYTADCVPLLFIDLVNKVIGVAHAGWKGTIRLISVKTVQEMIRQFHCRIENIYCIIGPSISQTAFEVDRDVYLKFKNLDLDSNYIYKKNNKWHINLQYINVSLLKKIGVLTKNIFVYNKCTFYNHKLFYSARRDGIKTGRMFTGVMLK